ncbi:Hsp20/alpha crystallin family protein [Clostridium weizhouense]|uniref:Hsp20 family protein n=1 Tax=Clostridium weizhouense TaxID=2859781 RepID=A0ABS7AS68_9CLOT|nr:Hsp20 family protein [Clostridium weizhouense]MBW6411501.1 Hsp20 family protein [Clostridium weizhouense]
MFRIFPFKFGGTIDLNRVGSIIGNLLENIDISIFTEEYNIKDDTYGLNNQVEEQEEKAEFINLEEYDDMYVLSIELKGVDLRQTSIQYNPGKISINLNKFEINKANNGMFTSNYMVKKNYIKEFDNIEAIEETKLIKTMENGVLRISMPKKYILDSKSKIVDVNDYIED